MTDKRILEAVKQSVAANQGKRPIGEEKLLVCTIDTLRFLIDRACRKSLTDYTSVSAAMGFKNAQWGNVAFGAVNRIRMRIQHEDIFPGGMIPDITAIVTQKGKLSAGKGLFANHEELKNKPLVEQLSELTVLRESVFRWQHWNDLLAVLGLHQLSDLNPTEDALEQYINSPHPRGKSPEHAAMQDCIRQDPSLICDLSGSILSAECEYSFWSRDRADVVVKTSEEWIGYEIKPKGSSEDDLRRGLYQVMKYRALLAADLQSHGQVLKSRCLLVLGGALPKSLCELAQRFRIHWIENFNCPN